MFSGYIIAVSFALEVLWGKKRMSDHIGIGSIAEGSLMLLFFLAYFVLLIVFRYWFGEFAHLLAGNKSLEK